MMLPPLSSFFWQNLSLQSLQVSLEMTNLWLWDNFLRHLSWWRRIANKRIHEEEGDVRNCFDWRRRFMRHQRRKHKHREKGYWHSMSRKQGILLDSLLPHVLFHSEIDFLSSPFSYQRRQQEFATLPAVTVIILSFLMSYSRLMRVYTSSWHYYFSWTNVDIQEMQGYKLCSLKTTTTTKGKFFSSSLHDRKESLSLWYYWSWVQRHGGTF